MQQIKADKIHSRCSLLSFNIWRVTSWKHGLTHSGSEKRWNCTTEKKSSTKHCFTKIWAVKTFYNSRRCAPQVFRIPFYSMQKSGWETPHQFEEWAEVGPWSWFLTLSQIMNNTKKSLQAGTVLMTTNNHASYQFNKRNTAKLLALLVQVLLNLEQKWQYSAQECKHLRNLSGSEQDLQ